MASEQVNNPGAAHYNAANSFVLSRDMGEAIYHYRMAQMFHPFDPNVNHNLESARLQILDSIREKPDRSVLDFMVFGARFVSPSIRGGMFLLGYFVVFLALWKLLVDGNSTLWKRTAIIAGVVSILAAASLLIEWWVCQGGRDGVVVVEEVVARTGDGKIYPRAFGTPLHAGVEFTLKETRGDWIRVELWNGDEGWLLVISLTMRAWNSKEINWKRVDRQRTLARNVTQDLLYHFLPVWLVFLQAQTTGNFSIRCF